MIESPVSPTARVTTWVLLIGLVITTAWLILGKIDIVASATGQIIPTDNVKLVQAANTGIVRGIYVRDGDVVRRGQPLIDLDPAVSTADEAGASKALLAVELDVARGQAIADALAGKGIQFTPPAGTPPEEIETQRQLIEAQVAQSSTTTAGIAAARTSALAEARAAAEQIKTYGDTVPVLDREIAALRELAAVGYAPGLKLLELERQRRSEAGEHDVAIAQQARGQADANKFAQQVAATREQARQQALSDLTKSQGEVLLRREAVTKAHQRSRLQRLVAPVDGTVHQIAVHTVGGVVQPVTPLTVIVPGRAIAIEVKALNKDIGFIRRGQPVSVKLEAFPFTRYGTVPGRIERISPDAVDDKRLGPIYVVRIAMLRNTIEGNGLIIPLEPGESVTAEILTGRRSLISYLLSQLNRRGWRLAASAERMLPEFGQGAWASGCGNSGASCAAGQPVAA